MKEMHCPRALLTTLAVIGDKYTVLIVNLLASKDMRFCQLEALVPGITPRTLTQRLERLQELGIIEKVTCNESPGRQAYSLMNSGKELDHVIKAMTQWGQKHSA